MALDRMVKLLIALVIALITLLGVYVFQGPQIVPVAVQQPAVAPADNPAPVQVEPESDPEPTAAPAN